MVKIILGFLCLALSTAVHAGAIVSLELDGNFYGDYTFYSYTSTTGQAEDDIPVDPYLTYLTGDGYNNTLVYSFCYDFNSPTEVGELYTGTFETFTDPASLEATYLINQLNGLGLIDAPLDTRGAIATAIWQIMNPSSTTSISPFPDAPAAQSWIIQAETAVNNGWWTSADSAEFPTWVPQDSTLQRFGLVLPPMTGTSVLMPEPGSLALIGCGLAGLAAMARKRRSSR